MSRKAVGMTLHVITFLVGFFSGAIVCIEFVSAYKEGSSMCSQERLT
jgi:hypothetical protein